jgi:hypothetical protein
MVGPAGLCTSPAPTAGRECPADDHLFNIAVSQSTAACFILRESQGQTYCLGGTLVEADGGGQRTASRPEPLCGRASAMSLDPSHLG